MLPPSISNSSRLRAQSETPTVEEEVDFFIATDDAAPLPRSYGDWVARLVYYLFAVAEILLALRVILKLIAANPASGFTRFIYAITVPLIAPFRNIVAAPTAANGSTLEISSLFAIVIYLIACWLLLRLLHLILERPESHPDTYPPGR